MRVAVVCQNLGHDRIIPRMARALAEHLGWEPTAHSSPRGVDVVYLSAYFEGQRIGKCGWPTVPVAAYFTHREETPPGNAKAQFFDVMGKRVQLRVATCAIYADFLRTLGPTVQAAAPLDRDIMWVGKRQKHSRPVVGLSGYTYANKRKGEDLVRGMLTSPIARRVDWRASGRGWPAPTGRYSWEQMGEFYRGLDVLVCPSRVEGIPMPPLEALACGVSVVIPTGVGLLDELMDAPGIYRYKRGDMKALIAALEQAAFPTETIDAEALAAVTAPYSIEAWCEDIRRGVAGMLT